MNLAELMLGLCKLTVEPFKLVICRRESSLYGATQCHKFL